ncbi:MAG: hypothetical protein KFKLKKLM_00315 [Flavobacteriales bacterium]|nr:hypothetical protein [Flavobacteriales bacterium]
MINDNNIEDWYKNELSNFEVNPNNNGWENISKQLNESEQPTTINEGNIESWYKTEINKFEAKPTQEVWDKLSTKLDLENVWTRVLSSLNKYERMIWWRNFGLRTAAIIALLYGSYLTYFSYQENYFEANAHFSGKKISEQNLAKYNSPVSAALLDNSKKTPFSKDNINTSTEKEIIKKSLQSRKLVNNNTTNNTPIYASKDKPNLQRFTTKKAEQISSSTTEKTIHFSNLEGVNTIFKTIEAKDFLVKKDKNKIIFNDKRFSSHFVFGMYAKRFYLGLNAGLKKQQLITSTNKKLPENLKQKSYLDFGYSAGATLGLIVSDQLNIETNVNFISTNGYKRNFVSDEMNYSEELNLNYTTVSLLAKKMNNKSTFDNKKYSTNLIGGIYGGYLTSAEILSNNTSYDTKNEFKSIDLGIVLGIEQDRYLTKELIITPGIRYQQGLLNISNTSSGFESAHTFTFEFNVGVKYIFLKKN